MTDLATQVEPPALEDEAEGISVEDLKVGMEVELILEPLHETDEDVKVTWKWRPVA